MRRILVLSLCVLTAAAFGLGEIRPTNASPVAQDDIVILEGDPAQVLPGPPSFEGSMSPGCEPVEPVFGPLPGLGGPVGPPVGPVGPGVGAEGPLAGPEGLAGLDYAPRSQFCW